MYSVYCTLYAVRCTVCNVNASNLHVLSTCFRSKSFPIRWSGNGDEYFHRIMYFRCRNDVIDVNQRNISDTCYIRSAGHSELFRKWVDWVQSDASSITMAGRMNERTNECRDKKQKNANSNCFSIYFISCSRRPS